jgi:hypothetical protein
MPRKGRKSRIRYSRTVEKVIYEKYEHRCAICGRPTAFDDGELDHIVPLGGGGPETATNLQWACHRCNKLKGNLRTNEEVRSLLGTPIDFEKLVRLRDKEGPSFIEITEPRALLSYDWIHSSRLEQERRNHIAWQAYEVLQRQAKLNEDGDLDPTFDDSNVVIFKETHNAIRSALNYVQEMERRGVFLRASIISSLDLDMTRGKLKLEQYTHKYTGPIFTVAARTRNCFKENQKEKEGESYIFMSASVKRVFDQIIEPEKDAHIVALGQMRLRDLLPIELYVYIHTKKNRSKLGQRRVGAFDVLFDEGHGQDKWYWHERPLLSLDYQSLVEEANKLSLNTRSIQSFSMDTLKSARILVIVTPREQKYSAEEVRNVETFVRTGGSLLALSYYLGDSHHRTNLNELLRSFGIEARYDRVVNEKSESKVQLVAHVPPNIEFLAISEKIYIPLSCSLKLEPCATEILVSDHDSILEEPDEVFEGMVRSYRLVGKGRQVLGAVTRYGRGKVAVLGSWQIFTISSLERHGFANRRLLSNLLQWLLEEK